MTGLNPIYVEAVVKSALTEDIGSGDITTLLTIPESSTSRAEIMAKDDGVVCGIDVAAEAFNALDKGVNFNQTRADGSRVRHGDVIAVISGRTHTILTAERVALNFLQRMSGIATLTAKYVKLVSHTKARVIDTRKTTPGLRLLEKYAVTIGGGFNHRYGLSDGILIKDNHIAAARGIERAVAAAKKRAPHTLKIEVEVTSLEQLKEAITAGADAVLLDNMTPDMMKQAVEITAGEVMLEASGGINEGSIVAAAETGVDLISIGELTHSPRALDISLNITTV